MWGFVWRVLPHFVVTLCHWICLMRQLGRLIRSALVTLDCELMLFSIKFGTKKWLGGSGKLSSERGT